MDSLKKVKERLPMKDVFYSSLAGHIIDKKYNHVVKLS